MGSITIHSCDRCHREHVDLIVTAIGTWHTFHAVVGVEDRKDLRCELCDPCLAELHIWCKVGGK